MSTVPPFIITEIVLSIFFVLYMVLKYARNDVKLYVKVLTFFSWLLSFGFVALVPIDIL
jgi:hypothetical protein